MSITYTHLHSYSIHITSSIIDRVLRISRSIRDEHSIDRAIMGKSIYELREGIERITGFTDDAHYESVARNEIVGVHIKHTIQMYRRTKAALSNLDTHKMDPAKFAEIP